MSFLQKILIITGLTFLVACSEDLGSTIQVDEISEAVEAFHASFNNGDYALIYETADPLLKTNTPPEKLTKLLSFIATHYGNVADSKQISIKSSVTTSNGRTITVLHNTQFEKSTETETFVFHKTDDGWKLLGYNATLQTIINELVYGENADTVSANSE